MGMYDREALTSSVHGKHEGSRQHPLQRASFRAEIGVSILERQGRLGGRFRADNGPTER